MVPPPDLKKVEGDTVDDLTDTAIINAGTYYKVKRNIEAIQDHGIKNCRW